MRIFPFPRIDQITIPKPVEPKPLILSSLSIVFGFLVVTGGIAFAIEWAIYRNYGKTKPVHYDDCGTAVINCDTNGCSMSNRDNWPAEIRCVYRFWLPTEYQTNNLEYSMNIFNSDAYSLKFYSIEGLILSSIISKDSELSFHGNFLILDFRAKDWSSNEQWNITIQTGSKTTPSEHIIYYSRLFSLQEVKPDLGIGTEYSFGFSPFGNLYVFVDSSDMEYCERVGLYVTRPGLASIVTTMTAARGSDLQVGCVFDATQNRIGVTNNNTESTNSVSSFLYFVEKQPYVISKVIQAKNNRWVNATTCSSATSGDQSGECTGQCCLSACGCCSSQQAIVVVTIITKNSALTIRNLALTGKGNTDIVSISRDGIAGMNDPKNYIYTDTSISALQNEIRINGSSAITIQALDAEMISFEIV
ncbi:unnamed protein product, partial [Mesorhabditis belari]|uniref:Uncharacterized protein n=1 Tax=Mesorhabditis belari TaxID=2138241 RepID=A0AAF3ENM6_9BILA